jgi:hypothetical protein
MPKHPALPMNSKRADDELNVTNSVADEFNRSATLGTALTFCSSGRRRHVPAGSPPMAD